MSVDRIGFHLREVDLAELVRVRHAVFSSVWRRRASVMAATVCGFGERAWVAVPFVLEVHADAPVEVALGTVDVDVCDSDFDDRGGDFPGLLVAGDAQFGLEAGGVYAELVLDGYGEGEELGWGEVIEGVYFACVAVVHWYARFASSWPGFSRLHEVLVQ